MKSLSQRIVVFFTVLLVVVLAVAFSWISSSQEKIATARLIAELEVGERVITQLLAQRSTQLAQAAQVLASDYGFREAVATHDVATITSVLYNHGARINASVVLLFSTQGDVIATTLARAPARGIPMLSALSRGNDRGSAVVPIDGKPYQIVVLPVRAPLPIAWVVMGFELGDALAAELQRVTNLQVSFVAQAASNAHLYGSTLPLRLRPALLDQVGGSVDGQGGSQRFDLLGEAFQSRTLPLWSAQGERVVTVLQLSVAEGLAPFMRLRNFLLGLAIVSVLVTVGGSVMLARGITRPINRLAQLARHIRDGSYGEHARVETADEIGELALSFNHMLDGIAARESEILRLAYRDPITGLPNRAGFKAAVEAAGAAATRSATHVGTQGAVALLDLDRFKHVNDTLGHHIGDQVLTAVGERLCAAFPAGETVARLGGDEFAIVIPKLGGRALASIAQSVAAALGDPIEIAGQSIDISASIGATCFAQGPIDALALLRQADVAMYVAKARRIPFVPYDPAFEEGRQVQLSLLGELRRAIENQELHLHYQPKLNLRDGSVRQAEALVRWTHRERGLVPPVQFIPFAEQTGYIRNVTRWVIEEAVRQCTAWRSEGLEIEIAVNVSARDLTDMEVVRHTERMLAQHRLPAHLICLEVTESGFMDDPQRALEVLNGLHALGVHLAIDDFGTGYSSLAYLKKLPVQALKIDRAFVKNMVEDEDDRMIVRSTIDLGHDMGLTVVAEGVEDAASIEALRTAHCDFVQGYFVSKPLPADQFLAWQRAFRPVAPEAHGDVLLEPSSTRTTAGAEA